MMALSLRRRLTLLLALATAAALGVATWIVDWRSDSEIKQRFDNALLAHAQELAASARMEEGDRAVEAIPPGSVFLSAHQDASWYILRCNGVTLSRTAVVPPPATQRTGFFDAMLPDGRRVREIAFHFASPADDVQAQGHPPNKASTCDLRYAQDRGPLDEILDSLDWILLGTLFGASALVVLLTPWLVHRGLRPLSQLSNAMAGIGPDAPGRRLPDDGTRELSPLVARFNDVLARMDAGLAREREFAAGLAHELRTRLTELRTLVDIETRYPSGRDVHELLGEAGAIGAELEATVAALLQLTRIESGIAQVRCETVAMVPMLQRACARHEPAATARGIRIEFTAQEDVALSADPALLDVVVDNLIGNAVAYTPERGGVKLCLQMHALEVTNQAPGLRAEDLSRFGRRFWRKSESGGNHAGLGLALAAAAARAQGMALGFHLDDAGCLRATLDWTRE